MGSTSSSGLAVNRAPVASLSSGRNESESLIDFLGLAIPSGFVMDFYQIENHDELNETVAPSKKG